MDLKELSNQEIENIYNDHMVKDFPKEELKTLDVMKKLIKKKNYICYGLYNNEELLSYAFLVNSKSYVLIDYYSVCAKYRNKGIGSEFLDILKEQCQSYDGIIVELEKVECASSEAEKVVRRRRIDFYRKNGMRMTNICSKLFNVNYSIMCLCNSDIENSVIYEELKNIYKEMISNEFYLKFVEVSYK